jgi:hypothetical protein
LKLAKCAKSINVKSDVSDFGKWRENRAGLLIDDPDRLEFSTPLA